MRPLPRLLAITTDAICRAGDFAERVAAIASAGPAAGIVVRAPGSNAAELAAIAQRVVGIVRPPEAMALAHARPDLARAVGAGGVQLRADDLAPGDARRVLPNGWIGVSVHGREATERAFAEGADFVVAGNVFATASHPDRPARGVEWLRELCTHGRPVIAIGGITPARAREVRRAGAWGAAAISALWEADDPAGAADAILAAWTELS